MSLLRIPSCALYGFIVTLRHNGMRDLRGCMIMQSTTWPWRIGVYCCRLPNVLQSKRTWRIPESSMRLVSELLDTVCDAITGFDCDWCSSRLLSSSIANQNGQIQLVAASNVPKVRADDPPLIAIFCSSFKVLGCSNRDRSSWPNG